MLETPAPSNQEKEAVPSSTRRRFVTKGRVLALMLVAAGGSLFAGYGHYTDPGPLQGERVVVIPRGGADRVVHVLQENGILAPGLVSSLFFKLALFSTKSQGPIHAAELKFPDRVSIAHSLVILRHGQPVPHSLTIAEGLTARRIHALLIQAPVLQGTVEEIREGEVAPQTFFYVWGTERQTLLTHMKKLMNTQLKEVWENRDQSALQGVITTPEQLLILASLIERETALPEERAQIARVFINRLKRGMKLQTDPTVIYAVSQGEGILPRALTKADLQFDSPYNSYLYVGLPPGPICSPGRDALEAAAHPAEGDALYFVATGHGGHNFSHSLAEHIEHVHSYRHISH